MSTEEKKWDEEFVETMKRHGAAISETLQTHSDHVNWMMGFGSDEKQTPEQKENGMRLALSYLGVAADGDYRKLFNYMIDLWHEFANVKREFEELRQQVAINREAVRRFLPKEDTETKTKH